MESGGGERGAGNVKPVRRLLFFQVLAFAACGMARAEADFHWKFYSEVSSGYLSSGGTLGDTRPVAVQQADWMLDFHEFGRVSGYLWTISSLHDRQRNVHSSAFNQIESAIYYGRDFTIGNVKLRTRAGPLWNPQIGYKNGHNCDWGWQLVQSLENSCITPYLNGLWMVAPSPRARIRFGASHTFALGEDFTIAPFVETVWMDRRRFKSRYGGRAQDRVLGGAFATATIGVRAVWLVSENWRLFVRIRQYDTVNRQSRRAVKRQSSYYAKCDYTVVGIGIECSF